MSAHTNGPAWASYLPLAVLAVVMLLRFRGLNRARRLRIGGLVVTPAVYAVLVAAMLWFLPPSPLGWACLAGGTIVGALVGWQRARLMRLHVDADSGTVMMRQSPAALVLLVAIIAVRRLIVPAAPFGDGAAPPSPDAMLVTDTLVGFALAMIVAQRLVLWRRARALTDAPRPPR